ncbi:MAG: pentapeptide repeat-containing protein [Coriobacteriia bacterium]|nr:pentapeptide repeat-containing protein [Coriobacteriia bacterium]
MATVPQHTRDDKRAAEIKDLFAQLESGTKDIFADGGRYEKYLKFHARFHQYSHRNIILIMLQRPDAEYIAGFNTWKNEHKRMVNKGEHGIRILAPAKRTSTYLYVTKDQAIKDVMKSEDLSSEDAAKKVTQRPDGKYETKLSWMSYVPVSVFDVSQTSGQPLPKEAYLATELTGAVAGYDRLIDTLVEISPYPVDFGTEDDFAYLNNGANGYFVLLAPRINALQNLNTGQLVVRSDMSQEQTIKTLIHEMTHATLHADLSNDLSESAKELEAESVAYIVSGYLGIDTSDYSFGYIAGWAEDKDLKQLQQSLTTIQKAAQDFIERIDKTLSAKPAETQRPELSARLGAVRAEQDHDAAKQSEVATGIRNLQDREPSIRRSGDMRILKVQQHDDEFNEILRAHHLWLSTSEQEGARADLSDTNCIGMQFFNADLHDADCHNICAISAQCLGADFSGADLRGANFQLAHFNNHPDRNGARPTSFAGADCRGADFRNTDLFGVITTGMITDETTLGLDLINSPTTAESQQPVLAARLGAAQAEQDHETAKQSETPANIFEGMAAQKPTLKAHL